MAFKKELIELCSEIQMFEELNEKEMLELSGRMTQSKFNSDSEIFKEGDPGDRMLIIANGAVEVLKERSHGSGKIVIARFGRGDIIGEASLIDRKVRSATVIATQPTTTYKLTRDDLNEIMINEKDIAVKLLLGLARLISLRLRNTSNWFVDVL
ncbi:cyclic nucleotide-binding domain-containing protein [bacterium]|nr:cyclic nucleotide-binding domain-containing protein [bacterium]